MTFNLNVRSLSLVPAVVFLGMTTATASAEAATLNLGDLLNIGNGFQLNGTVTEFDDLGGNAQPLGQAGVFGVKTDSSGGFVPFISNGENLASYEIFSVDFSAPLQGFELLRAALPDGSDGLTFEITSDVMGSLLPIGSGFFSAYNFSGTFKDIDTGKVLAFAEAIFTAQGFDQGGSYSATFKVTETVPEPATVLALFSVVSAAGCLRLRSLMG